MATTFGDLFLAILSLDVYNRGYNPGMTIPGFGSDNLISQPRIGDATPVDVSSIPSTSFYAMAYNWEGETVISYRGTTFPGSPDLGDMFNGWTLSAGFSQAAQPQEALAFYDKVQTAAAAIGQPVVLTGHSLGGGLAGFVSDLSGAPADVFNNIPFGTGIAAQIKSNGNPYGLPPISSGTVRQFITSGEVAAKLRFGSGPLSNSLGKELIQRRLRVWFSMAPPWITRPSRRH